MVLYPVENPFALVPRKRGDVFDHSQDLSKNLDEKGRSFANRYA